MGRRGVGEEGGEWKEKGRRMRGMWEEGDMRRGRTWDDNREGDEIMKEGWEREEER